MRNDVSRQASASWTWPCPSLHRRPREHSSARGHQAIFQAKKPADLSVLHSLYCTQWEEWQAKSHLCILLIFTITFFFFLRATQFTWKDLSWVITHRLAYLDIWIRTGRWCWKVFPSPPPDSQSLGRAILERQNLMYYIGRKTLYLNTIFWEQV